MRYLCARICKNRFRVVYGLILEEEETLMGIVQRRQPSLLSADGYHWTTACSMDGASPEIASAFFETGNGCQVIIEIGDLSLGVCRSSR